MNQPILGVSPAGSYQPGKVSKGKTEILFSGGGSVRVLEEERNVYARVREGEEWQTFTHDEPEQRPVHVRSSCVAGLIDLEHHDKPEPLRAA